MGRDSLSLQEVRWALDVVGLAEKFSETSNGLYSEIGPNGHGISKGEAQRLLIARSIVAKPRLLLMDEPLLGLSPILQADLTRAIKNIRQEGITVLVTEQFARTLLPVIDRGYVIENGILVFEGSRQELFDNPEVKSAYLGI